jgi:LytS/YehU family sensor histidine kinase
VTGERRDSTLLVRVRDDGVGLPVGWRFEDCAGVGLRNVASRLDHLYGRSDLLRVEPVQTGGVDVEIKIPLHEAVPTESKKIRALEVDA